MLNRILTGESGGTGKAHGKKKKGKTGAGQGEGSRAASAGGTEPAAAVKPAQRRTMTRLRW